MQNIIYIFLEIQNSKISESDVHYSNYEKVEQENCNREIQMCPNKDRSSLVSDIVLILGKKS